MVTPEHPAATALRHEQETFTPKKLLMSPSLYLALLRKGLKL